ncbi:MAG: hypothetical protein QM711_06000 [Micropruina sp.]|uniref:hypothetical protein n=1 Tax=Micropruina sp. TaxID=2737536 RepID=UPI0039E2A507
MSQAEYRESEPLARAASGPLQAWRRHWLLGVAAAAAGALIGVAIGFAGPATYTAESRVAVGAGDLSAGAVAGFPVASSSLASNFARYVNDRGVAGTDVPEGVKLSASQIPESNVIRIEAVSADPAAATTAANAAADQLATTVNTGGRQSIQDVFKAYSDAARIDAKAQTRLSAANHDLAELLSDADSKSSAIRKARDTVTDAAAKASDSSATAAALRQKYTNLVDGSRSAANLMVIRTAGTAESNRTSLLARAGLLGLAAGAVIGLMLAVILERRRSPAHATSQQKASGLDGA